MASVTVSGKPIEALDPWDERAMASLAESMLKIVKRRAFVLHKDANGASMPEGVDLVDTGALRDGFVAEVDVVNGEPVGRLTVRGPAEAYAGRVDDTYQWSGLTGPEQRALDALISAAAESSLERSS